MKFTDFFKKSKPEKNSQEKRNILLHFHIFKNAGSTIEWILEKNFPKKNLIIDEKEPGKIIKINKIINILKKNPQLKQYLVTKLDFQYQKILNSILFRSCFYDIL